MGTLFVGSLYWVTPSEIVMDSGVEKRTCLGKIAQFRNTSLLPTSHLCPSALMHCTLVYIVLSSHNEFGGYVLSLAPGG